MADIFFDLQRFAATTIEIPAGETYTLDGVTYTAITDSEFNLDDNDKISGIASGSVKATVTNKENSPTITFETTDGSNNFTLTSNGEVLTLTKVLPFELDNGTFTLAGNVLTVAEGSDLRIGNGRTYADGSTVFGHDYADTDIKYTITDTTLTEETERGTITFTASLGKQSRSITTVVSGKIINGVANGKFTGGFTVTKDSSMALVLGYYTIKATANSDATSQILVNSEGIKITPGSGDGTLNVALSRGGTEIISGELNVTGGSITFGYDNKITFAKNTSWDFTWNGYTITATTTDGATIGLSLTGNAISFTPGQNDGALQISVSREGKTVFQNTISVTGGSIVFNTAKQEISLTKGTVLTLTQSENVLEITALDDAGGNLSFVDGGLRFAPNTGDGALELNFASTGRKATLNVTGAFILGDGGKISLENGTEINLDWEDGTNLKLNSHGSTGSIALGEKGIQITSEDENLDLTLTTPDGYSTTITSIQGSVWYAAGTVTLDANTFMTGKNIVEGRAIGIKVEAIDGEASLHFANNGITYNADDGKTRVTYTLGNLESTFIVNKGSVFIQRRVFNVAEGSDLATNFKDFIPAQYFKTQEAGTYTINGQKIITSAANLELIATDDYMTFKTSDDVVTYKGMTLAGNGNVSLSSDNVVLGAGVEAAGFGAGKSFVLTEAGNVTVDGRVFELTENIPEGMTIGSADDGYTFSHTITQKEEIQNNLPSGYLGKVFSEKIFVENDDTYSLRADSFGLKKASGISDGAKLLGGDTNVDGNHNDKYAKGGLHLYVETDTEGDFTIGKKTYNISGDSNVEIKAMFLPEKTYASGFASLDGTVSGDFTSYAVSINGGAPIVIYGDKNISIAADTNGVEIFGLSDGASLANEGVASKVHTDTEGKFTFGSTEKDSIAITISGDSNVTFEFKDELITNIANVEGDIIFSKVEGMPVLINGIGGTFYGNFSSLGAYGGQLYVHDAVDGSALETEDEKKIWLQMRGETMTLNGNELTLTADSDGIWLRDKEIVGLDEGASLQVGEAGTYKTELATLTAKAGDIIVGLADGDAYIYDENNLLFTRNTPTEEIIDYFKPNESHVVGEDERGKFDITLEGGDLAVVENTAARVNITAGDDTIVSQGKYVNVSLTPEKNTWLFATGGNMTLENYDHSTESGFGTTYNDISAAIERGAIAFDKGVLSLGSAQVDMGTRSELMNFFERTGDKQVVGFAEHDAELDASDETDNLILIGGYHSTLTGGDGDDTIYAGKSSRVNAGAGENYIYLEEDDTNYHGASINVDGGGNTTVRGFKSGFDFDSDVLYFDDPIALKMKFDGTNLTADDLTNNFVTTFENISDGADFVEIMMADLKVAIANGDETITTDEADIYIGRATAKAGVDFSGRTKNLVVRLTNEAVPSDEDEMLFAGIKYVEAGDGYSSLIGGENRETLVAGNGYTSIWGGAGNDKLIGKGSSDDKDGSTTFFFLEGDGYDFVYDFNFLTAENERIADKIDITDANAVTDVYRSGNDVVLQINNSAEDHLTIKDAVGKDFRINNLIAKVDRNISYDGLANCYVATSGSSLTVESTVGSAEIWLDNSHGEYFLGEIRTLDASDVEGNTSLVGNDFDNTIRAGQGDSSLWGGRGDDLLQGGAAKNTFFYTIGDGFDTVTGVNDGDVINLADLTLEQIAATNINSAGVAIKFVDGGSLTVNGTADVTYQLADGSKFSADHAKGEWTAK